MNICLLGLSGSGKTCYIYAATHVLARGVDVNGHTISVTSRSRQQAIRLNDGIEQMVGRKWPKGSMYGLDASLTYPFNLKIDGKSVFPFTIYDYRGGALNGTTDNDQDEAEEIFNTFRESSCIIILVDGETIMQALEPEDLSPTHRSNILFQDEFDQNQCKARNKLNYIELLVQECNERMSRNVPILLVITKSDLFFPEELEAGKRLLKTLLPSVFSRRNDRIVGITAVTLGENLHNEEGNLTGALCLNTDGNIHLPILFALFQEIDEIGEDVNAEEVRLLIRNLFPSDKINFYRGGKIAFIV